MLTTDQSSIATHLLTGEAAVHRANRLRFPAYRLVANGTTVASLGRYSFFNIFFGRGQKIVLADRTIWRLRAVGIGPNICPLITNEEGQRVSQAMLRTGSYGIHGRRYGYVLKPNEAPGLGRENNWVLFRHDQELARFTRRPRQLDTAEPIPLAAALLGFVVLDFGIPGEDAPRIPAFRWT